MDHRVLLFFVWLVLFYPASCTLKRLSRFRTCNLLFNKKKSPHRAVALAWLLFRVWFWPFQVTCSRLSGSLTSVSFRSPLIIWLISSPACTRRRSHCIGVPRGRLVCWTWDCFSIYSTLTFLPPQFTLWLRGFNFKSAGKKQKEPQMDPEEPCPSERFVRRGLSIRDSYGRLKKELVDGQMRLRQVSVSITVIIRERWETLSSRLFKSCCSQTVWFLTVQMSRTLDRETPVVPV